MSFLSSLNISGSGITAQKQRIDIIAENITNQDTTRTADGTPYRRKMVVFQAQSTAYGRMSDSAKTRWISPFRAELQKAQDQQHGVKVVDVVEDTSDLIPRYDPSHPDANEEGYVMTPNVNNLQEMIDLMGAQRAYEANITVFNGVKAMAVKALEIGR